MLNWRGESMALDGMYGLKRALKGMDGMDGMEDEMSNIDKNGNGETLKYSV
jgi:hypothetical protein